MSPFKVNRSPKHKNKIKKKHVSNLQIVVSAITKIQEADFAIKI